MKESVLRAAAIASLALGLIISITTWIGMSTSSQRGSFFVGFFEFALILFLGVVAWALFNSLADMGTVRSNVEVLNVRLSKIEEALGVEPAVIARGPTARPGPAGSRQPGQGTDASSSDASRSDASSSDASRSNASSSNASSSNASSSNASSSNDEHPKEGA